MSAFVVIESSVKDRDAMTRYTDAAGPTLRAAGAEFLARAPWQVLSGAPYLTGGGLLRFRDKAAAIAWYGSAEYQAVIGLREQAMDSRFRLLDGSGM